MISSQRYGSYVNALNSIGADIDAANGAGSNYIVGETTYDNSSSNEEMIHAIIKEMYANTIWLVTKILRALILWLFPSAMAARWSLINVTLLTN